MLFPCGGVRVTPAVFGPQVYPGPFVCVLKDGLLSMTNGPPLLVCHWMGYTVICDSMRIHNVFHVSMLQPWRYNTSQPPPAQILLVKDDEQFEVIAILDHEGKGKRRKRSYLVSWRGYSPEDATWEPECNLENCSATLQEYWNQLKSG